VLVGAPLSYGRRWRFKLNAIQVTQV